MTEVPPPSKRARTERKSPERNDVVEVGRRAMVRAMDSKGDEWNASLHRDAHAATTRQLALVLRLPSSLMGQLLQFLTTADRVRMSARVSHATQRLLVVQTVHKELRDLFVSRNGEQWLEKPLQELPRIVSIPHVRSVTLYSSATVIANPWTTPLLTEMAPNLQRLHLWMPFGHDHEWSWLDANRWTRLEHVVLENRIERKMSARMARDSILQPLLQRSDSSDNNNAITPLQTLQLTNVHETFHARAFRTLIQSHMTTLRHLTSLSMATSVTDRTWPVLQAGCPKLTTLTLDGSQMATTKRVTDTSLDLMTRGWADMKDFRWFGHYDWSAVTHAGFKHWRRWPQLDTFTLELVAFEGDPDTLALVPLTIKNLTELVSAWPKLQRLDIPLMIPDAPPTPELVAALNAHCPRLEHIMLDTANVNPEEHPVEVVPWDTKTAVSFIRAHSHMQLVHWFRPVFYESGDVLSAIAETCPDWQIVNPDRSTYRPARPHSEAVGARLLQQCASLIDLTLFPDTLTSAGILRAIRLGSHAVSDPPLHRHWLPPTRPLISLRLIVPDAKTASTLRDDDLKTISQCCPDLQYLQIRGWSNEPTYDELVDWGISVAGLESLVQKGARLRSVILDACCMAYPVVSNEQVRNLKRFATDVPTMWFVAHFDEPRGGEVMIIEGHAKQRLARSDRRVWRHGLENP